MWSKLTGSPAPRNTPSSKGKAKRPAVREDPLASFTSSWLSLEATLSTGARAPFESSSIPHHLDHLLALLAAEVVHSEQEYASTRALGPCLEFLLNSQMLASLVRLATKDDPPGVRLEVIRWFYKAVTKLDESFLAHSAVHKPLVRLLRIALDGDGDNRLLPEEEEAVVEVMGAICERIKASTELLAVFFRVQPKSGRGYKGDSSELATKFGASSPDPLLAVAPVHEDFPRSPSPTPSSSTLSSTSHSSTYPASSAGPRKKSEHDFVLFAYLLRFVHREGSIGECARAGLLLLIEIAMAPPEPPPQRPGRMARSNTLSTITPASVNRLHPPSATREATLALAEYLLDSDFSEVLGAGLGALYGLLPGKLLVRPPGAASSSPGKANAAWDDPAALDSAAGNMVLGGMGALGDDVDPEEAERKREEEDVRLQALGVGVSDSREFREAIDGWLNLVEFVQDVVGVSATAGQVPQANAEHEDDDVRQQRLIASALSSSVSSSFRALFLEGVMYPSILECSETDGSAVAVLSYLDALLSVLEEGTSFEASVMGFLMGEEDFRDLANREKALSPSPAQKRVRRRKSSALVLLEHTSPRVQLSDAYFTSMGRFGLKDLLVSNVQSSSVATSTAALKLLQTIFVRHDRWSLGLLDVVLDESATSFPVVLREEEPDARALLSPPAEVDEDSDSESQSESDVFLYPTTPSTSARALGASTPPSAHSSLLLGSQLPPTPSISTRLDSFHSLLAFVGKIDPNYRSYPAAAFGLEIVNTGLDSYIRDAEKTMAADLGFRRGVAANPEDVKETVPLSPQIRRRNRLFGASPALSPKDMAQVKTGYHHRLPSSSPLLSLLLASLTRFFSHPPELNLALTAALASLTIYPYRSLDGWLLSSVAVPKVAHSELGKLIMRDRGPASDDGDDRSVDCAIDELSRQDAILSPSRRYAPSPVTLTPLVAKSPSLLSILGALASSVSQYRDTIPNFDRFLTERREGLMFSDNLADALHVDDDGGNAFFKADRSLETRQPETSQLGPGAKPSAPKLGAYFSPSSTSAYATPTRPVPTRHSTASLDGNFAVGASPFAAHYKQTGGISVTPIVVGATEAEDDEGPPESPSRRLSRPPKVHSSPVSEVSDGGPVRKAELGEVTLSIILDNVILLEEFIKELAGIVSVRRGLGIDATWFVDTDTSREEQ